MRRIRSALFLVALTLPVAALAADDPGTDAAYRAAMDAARPALGRRRPRAEPGAIAALLPALAAVPRPGLEDEEWLDLHIVMQEIERRLSPTPDWRGEGVSPEACRDGVPDAESLPRDPLDLIDAAAALRALRSPPGTAPPIASIRPVFDEARARLANLAQAAEGYSKADDLLLCAAAEVLAEEARDLAFELRCRSRRAVPIGRERFEWILRHRHRLDQDAKRTREQGEAAILRAVRGLENLAAKIGDGLTWQELTRVARKDCPADEDDLIAICREATEDAHRVTVESGLVSVPEFVGDPQVIWAGGGTTIPYACYYPGKNDKAGVYRARVAVIRPPGDLTAEGRAAWFKERDRHWLTVIFAHEGIPGHHLQHAFARQVRSPFRGYGYNTLYVEGWGLYTEDLMERAGTYDDPLTRLAWLRMRLWRAVRIRLDVGLHTGEISPAEAVRMLMDRVLLERPTAEREVERYLGRPASALSYMLGFERIRVIRRAYTALHGRDSERKFHDRLLGMGCVPLDLAAAVLLNKREAYDRAREGGSLSRK